MQTFAVVVTLALLYGETKAEILRLQCETYAEFSAMEENKRLNSTFHTLEETDIVTCKYECANDKRCKSINVNDERSICELNDKSANDPKDNMEANGERGWKYISPFYNETLVGINCLRGNNCKQNQKCMDICDCPGYRCIDKYRIMMNDTLSWKLAQAKCREIGGDLASIANVDEEQAIHFLLPEEHRWFWMGYNDIEVEGNFTWSDGMPTTYSNWGHGEAFGMHAITENCAMLNRGPGPPWVWYDAPCDWEINFVCQFY